MKSLFLRQFILAILLLWNSPLLTGQYSCPEDILTAVKNGTMTTPWLHAIANDASINQPYPSFSATQQPGYAAISQNVSAVLNLKTTSDLRSLYPSLEVSQINAVISQISNYVNNNTSVSACDQSCLKSIQGVLDSELTDLFSLRNTTADFVTFLKAAENYHVNTALVSATKLLLINNGDQIIATNPSGTAGWKIGWGFLQAIFGIFSIAEPESIIAKLLLWGVTGVNGIGSGVLAGHGTEFKIDLEINNELYATSAAMTDSIAAFYSQSELEIMKQVATISQNYGKMQVASACVKQINDLVANTNLTLEANLSVALDSMKNTIHLSTFQQLMPAKFHINYEFKCNCLLDGPQYCTDIKQNNPKMRPACQVPDGITYIVQDIAYEQQGVWHAWISSATETNVGTGAALQQELDNILPDKLTYLNVFFGDSLRNRLPLQSTQDTGNKPFSYTLPDGNGVFMLGFNKLPACENEYYSCFYMTCGWQSACADCTYPICIESCGKHCSSCLTAGSQITMADGSQRKIETINAGEEVMGVDGKARKVLFLGKTLRNQRPLYQINDLNFFFTGKHYFPTYNSDALAAVRVDKLRRYNASLNQHQLVSFLVAPPHLRAWTGNGTSAYAVNNIKQVELSENEHQFMYDLVLEGEGLNSFIVDGIGTYSEFFDLSAAPKTTMVVMQLMEDLKKDATLMAYSKQPQTAENMNKIAAFMLAQQSSLASFLKKYNTQDREKKVQRDLNTLPHPSAILKAVGGQDNWAVRTFVEELIVHNGEELIKSIDTSAMADSPAHLQAMGQALYQFLSQEWSAYNQ